jgi:hypothetical protein
LKSFKIFARLELLKAELLFMILIESIEYLFDSKTEKELLIP